MTEFVLTLVDVPRLPVIVDPRSDRSGRDGHGLTARPKLKVED